MVDLESGECRDFEGEKADISLLFSIIDNKLNPKAAKASSPGNKKIVFSDDIPAPSIIGAPIMPRVIQQQTVKDSTREMRAVVVYDYDATNEEELTIKEDDRLIVLNDSDPDWTLVKLENSAVQGFVPRSYITFGRNQGTTNDSPQKPVNDSLTLSNAKPAVSAEDMEKAIKIAKEQERVKAEQERIRKLEDMREKARRDEELKQQSKDVQGPTRPAPTPVIPARPQRTPDPTHSPQPVIPARPKQITPIFQPASSSVPPRPTNAAPRPPSPNKAVDAAPPPMPPRPNAPVSKPSTEQLSAPKQSLASIII